jgi:anti-anti-sigma regulatory factor
MIFSFFKKPPQKMVARRAAEPRPAPTPPSLCTPAPLNPPAAPRARVAAGVAASANTSANTPAAAPPSLDFVDYSYSQAASGVLVADDVDPVDADAEQAAMLWANAQVGATRDFLEDALHVHRPGAGERLWLMLFDLYRICACAAEFETLAIAYAQTFEKSPPIWRAAPTPDCTTASPSTALPSTPSLSWRGDLVAANAAGFAAISAALDKSRIVMLDVSALGADDSAIDAAGCARLLSLLQGARRAGGAIDLLRASALAGRLAGLAAAGREVGEPVWLLLLELLQVLDRADDFEEMAVAYAVTFEISPPSWESLKLRPAPPLAAVAASNDRLAPLAAVAASGASGASAAYAAHAAYAACDSAEDDAWRLCGELRGVRFAELPAFAATRQTVVIDCSVLVRIDFISAGSLFNTLEALRRSGKRALFRDANHLVAELLVVVGLGAVADISVARA